MASVIKGMAGVSLVALAQVAFTGSAAAQGCVFNATLNRNVQDLAGGRLANSPEFKFAVGSSLVTPSGVVEGADFFANLNYNWQSTVNYGLFDQQYAASITDARNFFGGNVVLTQQLARNYSRYAGLRLRVGF